MLRRGLIEAVLVLVAALASGCATVRPEPAASVPARPPAEAIARYDAVLAKLAAGDDAAAVPELTKLSHDYPDYAGPLLNLALIQGRNGQDDEAIMLFRQAAAVCEHCAPVWNELGVAQRRQGRFTDAEQSYRKAIEVDPDYALPYYNLAILCEIYSQRPDLALDYYQHYLDLGADSASAPEVQKWVTDLKRRVAATQKTARVEETP